MHHNSPILFVYISIFDMQNDKAKHFHLLSSVKWNACLKSCIGNGTFELRDGTAKTSRLGKR